MTLALTRRLIIGVGSAAALWAGWQLAHGSLLAIAVLGGIALVAIAQQLTGVRVDVLVGSIVLSGLIVGNRGFANLHLPSAPLLPAEAALALGVALTIWYNARQQHLPFQRDALNAALLAWITLSAIRLPGDVRQYGITAMRDFAMVYYAAYFFLGQQWHAGETARRWLRRCLFVSLAVVPVAFELFKRFPDVIARYTEVLGTPLIYIKGDSAAGVMAGGAAWCGWLAITRRKRRYGIVALALVTAVILSNSRAALVSLIVLAAWLAVARAWRLLRVVAIYVATGVAVALVGAALSRQPWHENELYRTYERLASVVDVGGTRTYQSTILQDKADNNDFRLTWWGIIVNETWTGGRWAGLGFGSDLADKFVRIYYPTADDEFSARSPHNVILTVFARTGMIGLAAFALVLALMTRGTFQAARRSDDPAFGWWLFAWGIGVSACFGVVLEGPMGAVVFWSVLGFANASRPAVEHQDGEGDGLVALDGESGTAEKAVPPLQPAPELANP